MDTETMGVRFCVNMSWCVIKKYMYMHKKKIYMCTLTNEATNYVLNCF